MSAMSKVVRPASTYACISATGGTRYSNYLETVNANYSNNYLKYTSTLIIVDWLFYPFYYTVHPLFKKMWLKQETAPQPYQFNIQYPTGYLQLFSLSTTPRLPDTCHIPFRIRQISRPPDSLDSGHQRHLTNRNRDFSYRFEIFK